MMGALSFSPLKVVEVPLSSFPTDSVQEKRLISSVWCVLRAYFVFLYQDSFRKKRTISCITASRVPVLLSPIQVIPPSAMATAL